MIPKRIVAIGTSAFFGYGDASGKGGYIGRLKQWHESENIDNAVFNLGISGSSLGETTGNLLKRLLPEAVRREPDLILLTSGINDVRRQGSKNAPTETTIDIFQQHMRDMIIQAKTAAKDVMVISTFPSQDKHDSSDNYLLAADIAAYATLAKKVCEEENVLYLDLHKDWATKDYAQFLFTDGVHANEKGYEDIFTTLQSFLLAKYA